MDRHRTAVTIAAVGLVLGIAADVLLRRTPWGINALIWTLLFLAGAWICGRAGERRVLLFPTLGALFAAGGLFWRDSGVLVFLDVVLLALFLPMLALGARGVRLHDAGLGRIAAALALTGAQSVVGFPQLVAEDLSWKRLPDGGVRGAGVALRGTLMALPALVVFGVLLTRADEAFARVLRNVFLFELDDAFLHLLCIAVFSMGCAGFLRSLTFGAPLQWAERPPAVALPAAETNFALGLINLLFAAFVAVQFRYLFGAAPDVLSAWARRGFFELVSVVALVMPMLLIIEWLIDKSEGARTFRILAATQIALVSIIAASAYRRMQLYRDEFGLTRLRLFTTAFMIWVAVLLVLFVVTVLAGRRERFAFGALVSGLAVVVVLHVINPDAMIVRTNLARHSERAFDANYAMTLSDDAAEPILTDPRFPPHLARLFALQRRPISWRTWNVSRARAITLAERYESKATPPMRP